MLTLFYILLALQLADIFTTAYLLSQPGYYETNRILAEAMDRFGLIPTLIISKGLVMAAITYFLPIIPVWFLVVFIVIYLGVFWNNIRHVI